MLGTLILGILAGLGRDLHLLRGLYIDPEDGHHDDKHPHQQGEHQQ